MKTIDEYIDFYYNGVEDLDRFHLKAMMTSYGKSCFEAGSEIWEINGENIDDIRFTYDDFSEYLKQCNNANN